MTNLHDFLVEFSDVQKINNILAAANTKAGANYLIAQYKDEETTTSVLALLQSAVANALADDASVEAIKGGLNTRVITLLTDTAENMATQYSGVSAAQLFQGADQHYLNRASELILERFDTLLELAKKIEKPNPAIAGELTAATSKELELKQ